jgi:hypothetical protein
MRLIVARKEERDQKINRNDLFFRCAALQIWWGEAPERCHDLCEGAGLFGLSSLARPIRPPSRARSCAKGKRTIDVNFGNRGGSTTSHTLGSARLWV